MINFIKRSFHIIGALICMGTISDAQSLSPFRIGNIATDKGACVAVDGFGNRYLGVTYGFNCDGDPGAGYDTLSIGATYVNGTTGGAVVSLDVNGNFRWSRQVEILNSNMATVTINDIVPGPNGTIWVLGSARGSSGGIDLDPSSGFLALGTTSNNQDNGFIWKLDTAGNVLSVLSFPVVASNSMFRPIELVISPLNEIVIVTTFSNSFDANPGAGILTLTSAGYLDYAIIRLDSNTNFIDAFSFGSSEYDRECHLGFDHSGNVYITGVFNNTVDFCPGPGVFNLSAPASAYGFGTFIVKLNPSFQFTWAVKISGATSATVWNLGLHFTEGNCPLIFGYYNGNPDWDPGSGVIYHSSQSISDLYLVQLDTNGGFVNWHSLRGSLFQYHPRLCPLPNGEFIIYGHSLRNMTDIDPGAGVYPIVSQGTTDMFAMNLDSSFQMQWIKIFRGPSFDLMTDLWPCGNGYFLFSGIFNTSINIGTSILLSAGQEDACFSTFYAPDNSISGRIFYDLNSNQIFDSADLAVSLPVFSMNSDTLIPGVNQQNASYTIFPNDSGTAMISYLNPPQYYSVNANQIVVPFGSLLGQADTGNNFVLTPIPGITDFYTDLAEINGVQVNRSSDYRIRISNRGTTTCGGTLVMTFDTILTYISSDSTITTSTSNSVAWTIFPIGPFEDFSTWVHFSTSPLASNAGDTVIVHLNFIPSLPDSTPIDNVDSLIQIVTNAYDPNFKETDQSIVLDSSFDQSAKYLNYTIHFQNEGTGNTQMVVVVDSIDTRLLDCSTFEFLQSSHPCGVFMNPGGELIFTFNNCVLTPYYTSELTSRGFVSFRMKLSPSFTIGDTIKNNADIYFDTNPPVITQYAINYIPSPLSTGYQDELVPANQVLLYPIPAVTSFTIITAAGSAWHLIDLEGKMVRSGLLEGESTSVNIEGIPAGMYFLEITDNDGACLRKAKLVVIN